MHISAYLCNFALVSNSQNSISMNEHNNRDENVLRDILSAARVLFERQGLRKTTMDDIASRIGKCKGALYYYFASKDEIFEAVVEQEMTEFFK